jgi:hypothetical protein
MTIANERGVAPTTAVENSRLTSTYRISDFSTLVFVWSGRRELCVYRALTHEGPEQWFHRDTCTIADKPSQEISREDVHQAIDAWISGYHARTRGNAEGI